MEIIRQAIPDVLLIIPKRFGDDRGYFSETWNRQKFEEFGLELDFVQDNHSLSSEVGTLRGLHLQTPPFAQDKLVRCTRGRILDVAVDIRTGSETYGQYVSAELSADNGHQFLVPKGFAHGFLTLEPDTEVQYKVTGFYSAECDRSIMWNDPAIGVDWGISPDKVVLSDKDRNAPPLADADTGF